VFEKPTRLFRSGVIVSCDEVIANQRHTNIIDGKGDVGLRQSD
jgi:hypothetical protein